MHLAWSLLIAEASSPFVTPAIWTAARFIQKPTRLVELLLSSGEDKFLATVAANQGLVRKCH